MLHKLHGSRLQWEFPKAIYDRLLQKQASAQRKPIVYDWDDEYATLHEYARWYPQDYGAMINGCKDIQSIDELKSALANTSELRTALALKDLELLRRYFEERKHSGKKIEAVFAKLFDVYDELSAYFLSPYYKNYDEAFCDAVWSWVTANLSKPKVLFKAAVLTNRSLAIIENYYNKIPKNNRAAFLPGAYLLCLTFQHNHELTKFFIQKQLELKLCSPSNLLINACDHGDLATVQYLVETTNAYRYLNECRLAYHIEMTPLLSAIRGTGANGINRKIVEYLLQQGADVLATCRKKYVAADRDIERFTAVNQAIFSGVKILFYCCWII